MSEYWESRRIDDIFDKNTDEAIKKLKEIYKNQGQEIKNAITELYIKMLEEGGISTTELYKFNRFNSLLDEINKILTTYGEEEIEVMTKALEKATTDVIGDIEENSNISFSLTNEKAVEEIVKTKFKGDSFSNRIWKNRENLSNLIEKNIQDIVASGKNKDTAVKEIMEMNNSSFSNTDRLVRTETMRCINQGQLETYKARGRTHGYYSYTKDKRTCDLCKEKAEKTKKEPLPLEDLEPVHHPNCRCTILPTVNLQNSTNDGKIKEKANEGTELHSVGKIDKQIYKVISNDITTEEVIIKKERIKHIKERHPNDYERFYSYLPEIVSNPDYIIAGNKSNTALILKTIEIDGEIFKTVLRLKTSQDDSNFKNSIITFMKIDYKEWSRLIRNKQVLYKRE